MATLLPSFLAGSAGALLILYFGVYTRNRDLTRGETMAAILILLAAMSLPFWW